MLNISGESGHPCLFPDLRGKSQFFPIGALHLQSLNPSGYKNSWKSASLIFPSLWLWENIPLVCIHSVLSSRSPRWDQGFLPSTAPMICFFPKPCLSTTYLPWYGLLFPLAVQFVLSVLRSICWIFRKIW